jgi:hypothetical protein
LNLVALPVALLRDECLNVHWFDSLPQAKQLLEAWFP